MATTFLSRFQREKSERDINNKEKTKIGGFSLALSRSSAALSLVLNKSDANVNKTTTETNNTQEEKGEKQQPRQPRRYIRSATAASVTQLLSDGCNNLLQRFRRNPSERPDKRQQQNQEKQQQQRTEDEKQQQQKYW